MARIELARLWGREVDGETHYVSRGVTRRTLYQHEFPEQAGIRLVMVPVADKRSDREPDMILYWEPDWRKHPSR